MFPQTQDNTYRLASDVNGATDATSTTLANITGMSFQVGAGEEWFVEAHIHYTTAATTTGFFLSATIPGSPTAFTGEVSGSSGAATNQIRHFNASAGGTAFGNALTGTNYIRGTFYLRVGATAGTFQLQFASEIGSSQVIVKAGSWMKYRRVS